MNKYSKRALKTTATVGMSLAMVLSAAAPVMAADINGTCAAENKTAHFKNLDLLDELVAIDLSDATNLTKVKLGGTADDRTEITLGTGTVGTDLETALTYFTQGRVAEDSAWACSSTDAEYTANKKKAEPIQELLDLFGEDGTIKTNLTAISALTAIEDTTSGTEYTKEDAEELIKFFVDNVDHLTAAEKSKSDANIARVEKLIAKAEKVDAAAVEAKLKDLLLENTGIAYADLATAGIYDIKGLENTVDAIDDYMAEDGKPFAREAAVKAVIKAINEKLDDLKDASNSSTALEDLELPEKFVKSGTDGQFYIQWAGSKTTADDGETLPTATNEDAIAKIVDEMDSDDFKTIATFDKVFLKSFTPTLEKLTTRGVYKLFFDEADVKTDAEGELLKFANIYYTPVMKGSSLKATGDFVKDLIEERMDEVETAYNLAMKASTLTTKVEDAIYELTDEDGMYVDNLTKAEFSNVFVKAASLGKVVGTTGWVDKGNGDWTFTDETGKAVTKWVAAGKEWYYVKAGNMLRNSWIAENASGARWYYVNDKGVMVTNTVVDGYTIDANGIWTK